MTDPSIRSEGCKAAARNNVAAPRERLKNTHIAVLRTLVKRDATARGITLPKWMRKPSIHLWRSGLIEIWYRQAASSSLEGPFFRLTEFGAYLALKFFPAPRGLSGVEEA